MLVVCHFRSFSQPQQLTSPQNSSFDTTLNIAQKPVVDSPAEANTTTAVTSTLMTIDTANDNSTEGSSTINTTTVSTNTEPVDRSLPPTIVNKDNKSNKS